MNTPDSLLANKSQVSTEFNKIARRYKLATSFSQGYGSDLQHSVNRMGLKGDEFRFTSNSLDAIFMAYGIRNMPDLSM